MVGQFKIYPVGKSTNPSKSGKYNYTFLNGILTKDTELLDKCQSFNWWTNQKFDFKFMEPVDAILDINGDFISVQEILD